MNLFMKGTLSGRVALVTGAGSGIGNASAKALAYAGAKAAALGRTLPELGKYKVRVNAICPEAITTAIDANTEKRHLEGEAIPVEYPEGEIPLTGDTPGTSGQVAQLVWFLASDASHHITGTEIYIDGAQSLLQG